MHTHLVLDDLIKSVLQEIGKFGLGSSTNRHYKQMYNRFKEFSAARNVDSFSNKLIPEFLASHRAKSQDGCYWSWQTKPSQTGSIVTQGLCGERISRMEDLYISPPDDAHIGRISAIAFEIH